MSKNLGNLFINGENGIVDSTNNHTINSNIGVTAVSNKYKFGSKSLYFDGTGHINIDNHNDFHFKTGDFTIDFWYNTDDITQVRDGIMGQFTSIANRWYVAVRINDDSDNITYYHRYNSNSMALARANFNFEANTWYHIAIVRTNGSYYIYVNGTYISTNITTNVANLTPINAALRIGEISLGTVGTPNMNSYLDNVRIVKGTALWDGDFDLTENDLFYENPVKIPTSFIYNSSSKKGNLRGKAKQGFIRPTIKQFFTSENFEEIDSRIQANDDFDVESLNTDRWYYTTTGNAHGVPTFNNGRIGGVLQANETFALGHKGTITGDFDAQVKVNVGAATSGYYAGIGFSNINNTSSEIAIFRNNNGFWRIINGATTHGGSKPSQLWVRIVRIGNVGYTYYKTTEGGAWSLFGSGNMNTSDGYFRLVTGVNVSSGSLTSWFDDFKINYCEFTNDFKI